MGHGLIDEIEDIFERFLRQFRLHHPHRHHGRTLVVHVRFGGTTFMFAGGHPLMAEIDVKDTNDVQLAMKALDAAGQVDTAAVETWSSSDANIVSIEDKGDGTALAVTHAIGRVDILADAKDPDGNDVTATLTINVIPGDAASVTIDATVVPKAAPEA